jgi:TDG/mug DNA glycosylase family protein
MSRPFTDRHLLTLKPLPDFLRPGLDIVFVGINPGVISAKAGHYYANPNNGFWRCLYLAGLTPVLLTPAEDRRILTFGYGLTDIIKRPSRGVHELRTDEFRSGRGILETKLLRHRPRIVCFNGKTVFAGFFGEEPFHGFGRQQVTIGPSKVFVVPSTSPANAHFSFAAKRRCFAALKTWLKALT